MIEKQISALEQDMNYYFNKVLEAVHQDTCYTRLSQYETKIKDAT